MCLIAHFSSLKRSLRTCCVVCIVMIRVGQCNLYAMQTQVDISLTCCIKEVNNNQSSRTMKSIEVTEEWYVQYDGFTLSPQYHDHRQTLLMTHCRFIFLCNVKLCVLGPFSSFGASGLLSQNQGYNVYKSDFALIGLAQ